MRGRAEAADGARVAVCFAEDGLPPLLSDPVCGELPLVGRRAWRGGQRRAGFDGERVEAGVVAEAAVHEGSLGGRCDPAAQAGLVARLATRRVVPAGPWARRGRW